MIYLIGILVIGTIIVLLLPARPLPGAYTPNVPKPPCPQCMPGLREENMLTGRHQGISRGVDVDDIPHQEYQSQRFRWRAVERKREKVRK